MEERIYQAKKLPFSMGEASAIYQFIDDCCKHSDKGVVTVEYGTIDEDYRKPEILAEYAFLQRINLKILGLSEVAESKYLQSLGKLYLSTL